jgi:hypothetical protein
MVRAENCRKPPFRYCGEVAQGGYAELAEYFGCTRPHTWKRTDRQGRKHTGSHAMLNDY